jgi:hypothetical protein
MIVTHVTIAALQPDPADPAVLPRGLPPVDRVGDGGGTSAGTQFVRRPASGDVANTCPQLGPTLG